MTDGVADRPTLRRSRTVPISNSYPLEELIQRLLFGNEVGKNLTHRRNSSRSLPRQKQLVLPGAFGKFVSIRGRQMDSPWRCLHQIVQRVDEFAQPAETSTIEMEFDPLGFKRILIRDLGVRGWDHLDSATDQEMLGMTCASRFMLPRSHS